MVNRPGRGSPVQSTDVGGVGESGGQGQQDAGLHRTVQAMYRQVGAVDGVVSVAAAGALDDFGTLTVDELHENLRASYQAWPHVTAGDGSAAC